MSRAKVATLALALLLGALPASGAPPLVLHLAAVAPPGSSWTPVLLGFARDVEKGTSGAVQVKWLLGGLAGDESAEVERVAEGALDGAAGAIFCERIAPSLRVLEVAGLVENDEEAAAVLRSLQPTVEEEFRHTPFTPLVVTTGFGHRILLSVAPVRTMAELRRGRYWIYNLDEVERAQLPLMGVAIVPSPLERAGETFDHHHLDGFFSIPVAAVAFGTFTRTHYFTDLKFGFLPGCLLMATRSFQRLTPSQQEVVRAAGRTLGDRFATVGEKTDAELLERQFQRAGLEPVPMSDQFHREFLAAARAASTSLGPRLVPAALVERVNALLIKLRSGH